MGLTDPIGNLLVAIQNASRAGKLQVDIPASRLGAALVECLKQEGFVQNWRLLKEGNPQGILRVYLKYTQHRKPILRNVRRISKPGRRIYVGKDRIQSVLSGIGISILTTPKGVLTGSQAKAEGTGGELICHVW